jgi:hypothetical protein
MTGTTIRNEMENIILSQVTIKSNKITPNITLFDTVQTDSVCTLLFVLWVQRCIGLELEVVDRLLKWIEKCVWRVIVMRGPTKWDASF